MNLRPGFRIVLVVFLTLGIFYPSLFAEPLSLDDAQQLQGVFNMTWGDIGPLFAPAGGLYYYRPLIIFSFFLDDRLFGLSNSFLHLENILFHLFNGLLLLTVVRRWCGTLVAERQWLPEVATLFFLLHPLVTEPVNWISGRTDLLAGLFVVAGMAFVSGKQKNLLLFRHFAAAACLLLGLFCKETAAMLLPAVALGMFWRGTPLFVESMKRRLVCFCPYIGSSTLYFLLRTGGLFKSDSGLSSAVLGAHDAATAPLLGKLAGLVKAFGFYVGKIFWPFPLNFAIVEINRPLCWILAIIALGTLLVFVLRRQGAGSYWLFWSALFIAPSLLIAVQQMAWTPLAERYLYIPLMGLTMAVALFLRHRSSRWLMVWGMLMLPLGFVTGERNVLWQKNLTLFADVAAKSPDFSPGLNEYASALYLAGHTEEARQTYQRAAEVGKGRSRALAEGNLVKLFSEVRDGQSVEEALGRLVDDSADRRLTSQTLRARIKLVDAAAMEENDPVKHKSLLEKSLSLQKQLADQDSNPFIPYRIGQLLLALDRPSEATDSFARACRSSDDYYTAAACKLEKNLRHQAQAAEHE